MGSVAKPDGDLPRQIGSFRIESELGRGGMGVVLAAVDTRLERPVAIKILPEELAQDPEHAARMEREAKVLASLDHPNIAGIYGFETVNGTRFMVLELIEGETLAERLSQGPLDLEDALNLCGQIAGAVESAHERGVIHRDLKPANIKITPDGRVKVLDFGLAKMFSADAFTSDPRKSPTITAAYTAPGVVLGTAPYMSPEQARGKELDKRTDIWSFGCILYECLTGRQAFAGETTSDVIAKILERDPDFGALPANLPAMVRLLLQRCLSKDPIERLRDIGDARVELHQAATDPLASSLRMAETVAVPATPAPRPTRRRRAVPWVITTLVGLVAGFSGRGWLEMPPVELRKFPLAIDATDLGLEGGPVISPDGKRIVYSRHGSLWVQDLRRLAPLKLSGTQGAEHPFWSPDGEFIGFELSGRLCRVHAEGSVRSTITNVARIFDVGGAVWASDGKIVFTRGTKQGLVEVPAAGGDPVVRFELSSDAADFHQPSALPDGKAVLFIVHRDEGPDTVAVLTGGVRKTIVQIPGERLGFPIYSRTGHVLFERLSTNPGIWAVPLSLSTLEPTGEPFLVVSDACRPSVSRTGSLLYVEGSSAPPHQLVWVSREGRVLGHIGQPQQRMMLPRLSPDETRVCVSAETQEKRDLWIHEVAGGQKTRLTFTPGHEYLGVWSPRGDRIAFHTGFRASRGRVTKLDGSSQLEELVEGLPLCYSPDEKYLLYAQGPGEAFDLWVLPLKVDGQPFRFPQTWVLETITTISPDSDYVAYVSEEDGEPAQVYLRKFPGGDGKRQVSEKGGYFPQWSRESNELFFAHEEELWTVSIETQPELKPGTPQKLFDADSIDVRLIKGYSATADGQRFVMVQRQRPEEGERRVVLVENWFAEFEAKK